jgi:hypothetical protein
LPQSNKRDPLDAVAGWFRVRRGVGTRDIAVHADITDGV